MLSDMIIKESFRCMVAIMLSDMIIKESFMCMVVGTLSKNKIQTNNKF